MSIFIDHLAPVSAVLGPKRSNSSAPNFKSTANLETLKGIFVFSLYPYINSANFSLVSTQHSQLQKKPPHIILNGEKYSYIFLLAKIPHIIHLFSKQLHIW